MPSQRSQLRMNTVSFSKSKLLAVLGKLTDDTHHGHGFCLDWEFLNLSSLSVSVSFFL